MVPFGVRGGKRAARMRQRTADNVRAVALKSVEPNCNAVNGYKNGYGVLMKRSTN